MPWRPLSVIAPFLVKLAVGRSGLFRAIGQPLSIHQGCVGGHSSSPNVEELRQTPIKLFHSPCLYVDPRISFTCFNQKPYSSFLRALSSYRWSASCIRTELRAACNYSLQPRDSWLQSHVACPRAPIPFDLGCLIVQKLPMAGARLLVY